MRWVLGYSGRVSSVYAQCRSYKKWLWPAVKGKFEILSWLNSLLWNLIPQGFCWREGVCRERRIQPPSCCLAASQSVTVSSACHFCLFLVPSEWLTGAYGAHVSPSERRTQAKRCPHTPPVLFFRSLFLSLPLCRLCLKSQSGSLWWSSHASCFSMVPHLQYWALL